VPRLRFSREAQESIAALAPRLQDAILNTILVIQADPWAGGSKLRGRMQGVWVARVGSYRVLYTIEGPESAATVVVREVLHRSIAYRRRCSS
jgi:mRNA-degrading endonuclease RelE of RelBE toxin-antitoxin system